MRKIFLPVFAMSLLTAISCQDGKSTSGAVSPFFPFVEKAYAVKVHAVTVEERPWIIERPARLETFEQAVIRAEWDARIKEVLVRPDQDVQAGAVLVRVEHEKSALEVEKKRAEIRETEAQIKLDKGQTGAGSPDHATAADKVTASEAKIDRIKAEIALLESDQEKTEITSPLTGIITKKAVTEGLTINKGDELFTIVRINPIVVAFDLPQEQIAAATAIEELKASFPPLEERSIPATQVNVLPERQAGGFRVKATMSNEGSRFKAGLEGTVRLVTTRRLQILKVPNAAILEAGGKKFLYRIKEDLAHSVDVETGETSAGLTEITRGLTVQDQIVVDGQKALREGVAVQIKTP